MDYIVKHGRPLETSDREKKEIACYDLLDQLGIEYDRIDHEAIFDMAHLKEVRQILGISINKNLFLCNTQQTKFYLLLMPGEKPFKTRELSRQINSSRLSFAPEDKLLEILNLTPGSVNILSLANDKENKVQLLIDQDLLNLDVWGMHPMRNTTSLKIKKKDILERFLPYVQHKPIYVSLKGE